MKFRRLSNARLVLGQQSRVAYKSRGISPNAPGFTLRAPKRTQSLAVKYQDGNYEGR